MTLKIWVLCNQYVTHMGLKCTDIAISGKDSCGHGTKMLQTVWKQSIMHRTNFFLKICTLQRCTTTSGTRKWKMTHIHPLFQYCKIQTSLSGWLWLTIWITMPWKNTIVVIPFDLCVQSLFNIYSCLSTLLTWRIKSLQWGANTRTSSIHWQMLCKLSWLARMLRMSKTENFWSMH